MRQFRDELGSFRVSHAQWWQDAPGNGLFYIIKFTRIPLEKACASGQWEDLQKQKSRRRKLRPFDSIARLLTGEM